MVAHLPKKECFKNAFSKENQRNLQQESNNEEKQQRQGTKLQIQAKESKVCFCAPFQHCRNRWHKIEHDQDPECNEWSASELKHLISWKLHSSTRWVLLSIFFTFPTFSSCHWNPNITFCLGPERSCWNLFLWRLEGRFWAFTGFHFCHLFSVDANWLLADSHYFEPSKVFGEHMAWILRATTSDLKPSARSTSSEGNWRFPSTGIRNDFHSIFSIFIS